MEHFSIIIYSDCNTFRILRNNTDNRKSSHDGHYEDMFIQSFLLLFSGCCVLTLRDTCISVSITCSSWTYCCGWYLPRSQSWFSMDCVTPWTSRRMLSTVTYPPSTMQPTKLYGAHAYVGLYSPALPEMEVGKTCKLGFKFLTFHYLSLCRSQIFNTDIFSITFNSIFYLCPLSVVP